MAGVSLNGRDQMLAAFFTPELFILPDAVWVALCLEVPSPGATGDDLIEPEDTAYIRGEYSLGVDWWAATGRGGVANTAEIVYPDLTADYGEVVGWALCDSQYGGATYVTGALLTPQRFYFDQTLSQAAALGAGAIVVNQT